jgi:hypothetical protein
VKRWYNDLRDALVHMMRFSRSAVDSCLYVRSHIVFASKVDDGIIVAHEEMALDIENGESYEWAFGYWYQVATATHLACGLAGDGRWRSLWNSLPAVQHDSDRTVSILKGITVFPHPCPHTLHLMIDP